MEQELISAHFEKSEKIEEFLTATDIMLAMNNALGLRLNNIKIGKALTSLKYQRMKHPNFRCMAISLKESLNEMTYQSYQVTLKLKIV
jgi:hypothetical protein